LLACILPSLLEFVMHRRSLKQLKGVGGVRHLATLVCFVSVYSAVAA